MARMMGVRLWVAGAVAALSVFVPRGWAQTTEHWYVLEMMGSKAGYQYEKQTTAEGRITTETAMVLTVKRGPIELKITTANTFVETAEGKPVSLHAVNNLAAGEDDRLYVFKDDHVDVTTTRDGVAKTSRQPAPEGAYLTPAAAERLVQQRLASGAKEITVRTLDATMGLAAVSAAYSDFTPAKVSAMGREIETTKMKVIASNAPQVPSFQYVDAEGTTVRVETQVGGLTLAMTLASKEDAMGQAAAPELMLNTFIRPEGEIKDPRRLKHAVYVLSVDDGDPPSLPTTGAQRTIATGERSATLDVRADRFEPAPEGDAADHAYTGASPMLDSEDEQIVKLKDRALRDAGEGKPERAETLRRFVYRYIKKKSLGVGFASASETAKSREGDCSEHGVLLAALLRADGIPSRVVAGLEYVDGFAGAEKIFGYHMWTQALLEIGGVKRWVDLDGTLPPGTPFDATHIALATSSLAEGESMQPLANMAPTMGRLKIKVEKAE